MAEGIAQFFVDNLSGRLSPELIAFIISMLPILELRGGMIAAKLMGIEFLRAFVICYIGNMLPVPFILFFIRRIFTYLKGKERFKHLVAKIEERSLKKADKIKKYRLWGLFLFVAIPLPGTGAWTGALAADLLDIRIKHSLPVISVGVVIAGIIMAAFSYGLLGLAI